MRCAGIYLVFIALFSVFSCAGSPTALEPVERVQSHMGTYARVLIYDGTNRDADAAFSKIKELDDLLSDYNPESDISKINTMAGVKAVRVDPQVIEILKTAKLIASDTDGAFDPTIGALTIGVYRFGRESGAEPDLEQIERAKTLVNYRDLIIEGEHVLLKRKGMMIDLGGVGKGYAVDKAVDVLKQRGVKKGVVALSGDLKVFGGETEIAIKHPDSEGSIARFTTRAGELAVSTSGGYERFVNVDSEVYHHLLVPETGKPGSDFLSLTVLMRRSSTLADAYATALFVMGKDKAVKFLDTHDEIGVFIVFPDKKIYYNETFTELVDNLDLG